MTKPTSLLNAAMIVMASIFISRVTGFIREMLVPNILGTNQIGDAYNIAFRITGLMYDLLVGGAIAAALIPILSGYLAKKQEEEGWKVISSFINFVMIAMVLFSSAGVIFAPQLVKLMAAGFQDPLQISLTVKLVRILFPSVAFLMMAGLLNGVLNSYQRFVASAFGPTLYNIGCTLSLLFIGNSKFGVTGVAYGIVLSSFTYFLLQLIFTWKNLKQYQFHFLIHHEGFRKLMLLALPSLGASSVIQINVIITGSFVSLFDPGSVTAFNLADRTWQMPFGILAQGIGIAILPSLSAMLAKGEVDQYVAVLEKSIKTVLAMMVPCAAIFIALDQSIVETIFKFTNLFNEGAVILAGNILMIFSFAMVSQSLVSILIRAFYAANNSKIPFYTGGFSVILVLVLSFLFYRYTPLEASGMALAYTIASFFNAILLLYLLHKNICKLSIASFRRYILSLGFCGCCMGILLHSIHDYFFVSRVGKLEQIAILCLEVLLGLGVFILLAYLLKIKEVLDAINKLIPKRFHTFLFHR